jgi:hypothetical protein
VASTNTPDLHERDLKAAKLAGQALTWEKSARGLLLFPQEQADELIAFHREFLTNSPDELGTTLAS